MAVRWPIASGNWSTGSTWNDFASLGFPTADDVIYSNNFNINIDQSFSAISLNNTARARTIATPAMTANNAPSPFVAAASAEGTAAAFNAFNRVYTTTTFWAANAGPPQWLSMDFGSGSSIVIDGYTIYGTNDTRGNPNTWQFQGSDNNSTWTTLHSVSATTVPANGTYSVASIGNVQGYRYYRINITQNGQLGWGQVGITELELYERFTAALAAGGSFIFNSGSISGSATSTTAALTAGATNLIQVTAATGSVTLRLGSDVNAGTSGFTIIRHSGNCDFNLIGNSFIGGNTSDNTICITKTSSGTINITGNLTGGGTGLVGCQALRSTAGNTVVLGNVSTQTASPAISQTAGNVTVTGNVIGGNGTNGFGITLTGAASQFTIIGNVTGGTGASAHGISFSGTSGSVTGTVTGGAGSGANGINTSGVINVTGNVNGGAGGVGILASANATVIGNITGGSVQWGIGTASNVTLTLTGTVTATSTVGGAYHTGTGTVLLTGNMINVAGKQAVFAQNLFISNTTTTQWRLFTPGGQDKTLYSADTFPNQPSSANVRSGSLFGPSNVLSGSMVVPIPSNVRVGVLTDNTVGTGQSLTAADFLAAISASADPYAQRLRNVATVDTVGSLLTGFNNGGF